LKHSV